MNQTLPRLAALLTSLLLTLALTPASAGSTYSEEYVANGFITIFCEGDDHDELLHEPWCLALTTLNGGEHSVIGGAEWDVAAHLGSLAVYSAIDDVGGLPHTVLGIGDHVNVEDFVEGCGTLVYQIPADAEGDEIDGGIHLVAQISIVHLAVDLDICLGSAGVATIDIA